nr:hypothetical protein [uncultured Aquabacterium sp.]
MPQPMAARGLATALACAMLGTVEAAPPTPAAAPPTAPTAPAAPAAQTTDLPAMQPVVRLPSITSRFRRPGAPEAPDITLDDIERCLGQDMAMQQDVHATRQRQQALTEERASIEQASNTLQAAMAELEKVGEGMKVQSARWSEANTALQRQGEDIERKRLQGLRQPADVNAFNALVKAHNAELERLREWRARLLKEHTAFEQGVVAHNARNADANASVAAFNVRNDAFRADAAALAARSGQAVAECGGTRTLRK